jgi:hypothetical protein
MRLRISAPRVWLGPGTVIDDAQIVCEDGTITYAGPATPIEAPGDRHLAIDGFVMPACADRHVHIELSDPAAVLRRGVTAVRDLAWPPDRIFPLADLSETPAFDGPLIRAAGPMLKVPGGRPRAPAAKSPARTTPRSRSRSSPWPAPRSSRCP